MCEDVGLMPTVTKPFKIWIPQAKDEAFVNITITDSDGTVWTIADDLINFEIIWPTFRGGGVASFNMSISSNERKYLDKFSKGNVVSVYMDYTDGTTLYKTFYMEEPKYGYSNGYLVYIRGRDYPQIADIRITKSFIASNANDAFNLIITDYFSTIVTTTGIAALMTDTITANYDEQSAIKVLADIVARVNYDARIEADGDVTTFVDTGVLSTTEAIILGQNVKFVSGFGPESEKEKNRTRIVGDEIEECLILKMKEDKTAQGVTWIKDEINKNSAIKELDDAEDVATYIDANKSTMPDEGTVTSVGMATVKPGQLIMCSIPDCKIIGDYYVKNVKHKFNANEGFITEIDINQTRTLVSSFLNEERDKREKERNLKNPNEMTDTLILLTFDNQDGISSSSNLVINNGKMSLTTGQSAGTMITDEFVADSDFTEFEIRGARNDDMALIEVYFSNDGGYTYKQLGEADFNQSQTFTTSAGDRGRLKVILRSDASNAKPELDSISVMIKR